MRFHSRMLLLLLCWTIPSMDAIPMTMRTHTHHLHQLQQHIQHQQHNELIAHSHKSGAVAVAAAPVLVDATKTQGDTISPQQYFAILDKQLKIESHKSKFAAMRDPSVVNMYGTVRRLFSLASVDTELQGVIAGEKLTASTFAVRLVLRSTKSIPRGTSISMTDRLKTLQLVIQGLNTNLINVATKAVQKQIEEFYQKNNKDTNMIQLKLIPIIGKVVSARQLSIEDQDQHQHQQLANVLDQAQDDTAWPGCFSCQGPEPQKIISAKPGGSIYRKVPAGQANAGKYGLATVGVCLINTATNKRDKLITTWHGHPGTDMNAPVYTKGDEKQNEVVCGSIESGNHHPLDYDIVKFADGYECECKGINDQTRFADLEQLEDYLAKAQDQEVSYNAFAWGARTGQMRPEYAKDFRVSIYIGLPKTGWIVTNQVSEDGDSGAGLIVDGQVVGILKGTTKSVDEEGGDVSYSMWLPIWSIPLPNGYKICL